MKYGSPSSRRLFTSTLQTALSKPEFDLLAHLPLDLTRSNDVQRTLGLTQLFGGLMLLNEIGLLKDIIPEKVITVLNRTVKGPIKLVPLIANVSESLFG